MKFTEENANAILNGMWIAEPLVNQKESSKMIPTKKVSFLWENDIQLQTFEFLEYIAHNIEVLQVIQLLSFRCIGFPETSSPW